MSKPKKLNLRRDKTDFYINQANRTYFNTRSMRYPSVSSFAIGTGCLGALFTVSFYVSIFLALVLWTDRTLEYWLSYWKGIPVDVPLWLSAAATIVGNGIMLFLNVISEIVRLVS